MKFGTVFQEERSIKVLLHKITSQPQEALLSLPLSSQLDELLHLTQAGPPLHFDEFMDEVPPRPIAPLEGKLKRLLRLLLWC